jgi:hypothetical protein
MSWPGEKGQQGPPGLMFTSDAIIKTYLVAFVIEGKLHTRMITSDKKKEVLEFLESKTRNGNQGLVPHLEHGEWEDFILHSFSKTGRRKKLMINILKENGWVTIRGRENAEKTI